MRIWPCLVATVMTLGGCVAPGPEGLELANIRPSNIVPKTSPARLATMFADICLDGPADADTAAARLRAMDYVEVPARHPRAIRSFVVDDSRPAVMLGADGRSCALAAQSRTGQTERLRSLIAGRYPQATAFSAAGIEQGWVLGAGQGTVALRRVVRPGKPSELIVLRQRG
ncbi:hypothetical protein [Gemmobacter sp.]|uniref:hypothetical protein n=1 Tax=Gemmobacter sp. TaxID=1898957 RepID=UPI002AFE28EE|nr:hypothetical protein [Gemmobacter sp.]